MTTRPADHDPFDLGFDADDEFAPSPSDPWRDIDAGRDPGVAGPDPFADFPPARGLAEDDPFDPGDAASPIAASPAPPSRHAGNPVGEMIAGAEAALGDIGVPRITIHVFCAQATTAELAEQAASDRRMGRAATVVRPGGVQAAVEHYQNQPTPSLVVVESLDPAPELLARLDQLAEVCDPGTKVIVVGAANDIALYRELMRRGVSEYLVPPLSPLLLIRAISGLYADPSAPFAGRQIAVVGAKGGVGASTLAHNLAWALAEHMQSGTVLADFDLPFGTAGLNFNQDPLQGVADALGQPDRLDPVLMDRMMVRVTDRLSLFAAPATLEQDFDIQPDAFEEVAQKIRGAAPFAVLDLPHAWSAWKRRMLVGSDDLVIVATPDLASLRNAKNMIDLVRQARPNDAPPRLVLNQVGVPGRPEIPAKDFAEALGLQTSLVLPFEPKAYGQAANHGQMISEVAPKSKAAEGVAHLAQLIARREPPAPQKTSLLGGLFKKK
ncbi:AAA family ATPase [Caulobacter mirabilis]|uniref:Pilus assembly protein CpaE n=1 Tax=Caulobacter mirabilis TaxID=69666 RepID=A0A2D2ASJ2_9CAUL|nr:CpaE family protein [Caulobacter mirabilis]ATQ40935.1 pilus assembly protein CpaE [Caulobacter mirabilis]